MSVIVYGPMACGKTSNAERLRKFFGCAHVVDGWDDRQKLPRDSLALTNEQVNPAKFPLARIVSFADAMRMADARGAR